MSMLSNLELLRRVPLFAALTPTQSASIADAIVKKRFKRAEVVVEQGKKSDALYIILTGRARVTSTDSRGREVILATLHPGDYIGEMSLIDDEPHSATVRTEIQMRRAHAGPRRLRALPARELLDVLQHHARPGAAPAPCRPQDRVAGVDGRLRTRGALAARVRGRRRRGQPQGARQDLPPGLWPRWSVPRAKW